MGQWIKLFVDIATWRRGPQDLPPSRALLYIVVVLYVLMGVVQIRIFDLETHSMPLYLVADATIWVGGIWLLLTLFRKQPRFLQTTAATLGCMTLLGVLDIVMYFVTVAVDPGSRVPDAWQLCRILLACAVVGRIFKAAFDTALFTGIGLVITMLLCADFLTMPLVKG